MSLNQWALKMEAPGHTLDVIEPVNSKEWNIVFFGHTQLVSKEWYIVNLELVQMITRNSKKWNPILPPDEVK